MQSRKYVLSGTKLHLSLQLLFHFKSHQVFLRNAVQLQSQYEAYT